MRTILIALVLALAAGVLSAQEWISLTSGSRLRGEIVAETEKSYALIDLDGRIHQVAKAEVKRAKRKSFRKEVQARLDEVPADDLDGRVEIAAWAAESKKTKRDAPRIALRVLARDPEHAGARAHLGHVKVLGQWYRDRKTANVAVAEKMEADGFVAALEGWVRAERLAELEAAPDAWMLTKGIIWRKTDEVMRERGFHPWKGEWYPPEEERLVEELARLEKRTKQVAQAARAGSTVVYHVSGREVAQEHAKNLEKARTWFCETLQLDPKRQPVLTRPTSRVYVLQDMAALKAFGDAYAEDYGMSEQDRAFAMQQKHLVWKNLGHATTLRHNLWRHLLVAQMGGDLTQRVWHHGFAIPAWIWVASAHNAEIAVFGDARVQYIGKDQYGRSVQPPNLRGMGLRDIKNRVKQLYKDGEVPGMKFLFHRHYNQLTGPTSITGIALFHFFLEKHRKGWMKFLGGEASDHLDTRFESCLKTKYELVDQEFKEWIMASK